MSIFRLIFGAIWLLTAGCQSLRMEVPTPEVSGEATHQTISPAQADARPETTSETNVNIETPEKMQPLGIILSDALPGYVDVADELTKRLARPYRLFYLNTSNAESTIKILENETFASLIAIGEPALQLLSRHNLNSDIIYSQVFDPPESGFRGVSAIPPMQMQIDFWRSRNPNLNHIGIVNSKRLAPQVAELVIAAEKSGIKLSIGEAYSDKAALHQFRRMVPNIDGFIILPDASILSPNTLTRMVQHANANGVQLLTYNIPIFQLGTFLHITSSNADIADRIIDLLNDKTTQHIPLTALRVKVSGAARYANVRR
ncbi:MAG: ABC transporter substrate-binding protein [Pseudomonadales bacterium]|nr:ABC transporter substrate-binding protein [Pseudomonadales bacterium]